MSTKELNLRRRAKIEDPVLRGIIQRVKVQAKRGIFQLGSHGLLVRQDQGTLHLVIPSSSRQ